MLRVQLEKRQEQVKEELNKPFVSLGNILRWLELKRKRRKEQEKEDWFDFLDQSRSEEEKLWDKVTGKEKIEQINSIRFIDKQTGEVVIEWKNEEN